MDNIEQASKDVSSPVKVDTSCSVDTNLPDRAKEKSRKSSLQLICSDCNNSFQSQSKLDQHSRIHTGVKPFNCSICEFETAYVTSYTYHVRSHLNHKPYQCNVCEFKFVSSTMLTRHKRVHSGERPFSCNFCSYKATAKGTLTSHLRRHTGERPFACATCNKKFVTSSALTKHKKLHLTESQKQKCLTCGQISGVTHECYICQFCTFSARNINQLKGHLLGHEEYIPHQCVYCPFKSRSIASVKFHEKTKHLEVTVRTYECNGCREIFSDEASMSKHSCTAVTGDK